jgi:hypothetical protein
MTASMVIEPMKELLVKDYIFSVPVNIQTPLQVTISHIHLPTLSLTVCNIYLRPSVPVSLAELMNLISQLPPQCFWWFQHPQYPVGSAVTDNRGRTVSDVCARFDLIFLNMGAVTCLGSSLALDLAFCSPGIAIHLEWSVLEDLHGSGHYPISLHISGKFHSNPVTLTG